MARRIHKKTNIIIIKPRRVNHKYKDRMFTNIFNDPKEVLSMLTAEFNMKTATQVWKEMGIEEGRVITAENMIKMGFNKELIIKATELDSATVEKLYNELHR